MPRDFSASSFVQLLRAYYPVGLHPGEPAYDASVEARHRRRFLEEAQKDMGGWKAFVTRVRELLPDCSLWDSTLLIYEPCYRLRVSLPHQQPDADRRQEVVCLLSVLAPVYVLYASYMLYTGPALEKWTRYPPLPPAFQECETRLARLVEDTFRATRLSNELLFTPVPDMTLPAANLALGQARLIDLLFTEDRW